MSSSDPPHLRLSLPQTASTFKRSFEQFGFDLEPTVDSTVVASSSSTDEHRPGPSNGDRNKRARSSSVTPSSAEQARSMDSSPSSNSSHTISSGSSNHAVANHPPASAPTRHPLALENDSAFSSSVAGELSHTSSGLFDARPPEASPVEPPTSSVWPNAPSSTNASIEHNEQFRLSMERFHAFDSQISSIRSRPSPLPFHIPSSPPTLPPLTLSSPVEHSHSHSHLSAAVSLPSVESLSYTSTTAQTSASVPPPTAPPSTATPSDQYHSGVSSVGFEEFGEFREMMGFFPEQHPNSPSVNRPAARPRHQSPSLLDDPERPQIDRPFRRPPSRQTAENTPRNSTLHPWSSNRRGAALGDSDDEFGGRPVLPNLQGRGSLDLPRSRLDSSLLASRIRRSMQSQAVHPVPGRMSPPRFPAVTSSQLEPNSTHAVNNSRAQEPERFNRHEPWSSHPPSRRPVLAEAFRSLAERLGRGRQRTNYTTDSGAERSRSPVGGVSSSSTSPAYDDWVFGFPDFSPPEDISYGLDLPMPPHWLDEEIAYSRLSMPSSRIFRDTPISGQAPWRSSLPSNDTSEDRILTHLSFLHRPSATIPSEDATQSDSVWRRLSYTDFHPPHLPSARTSSRGDGTHDLPSTRAPHAPESSGASTDTPASEVGTGWRRGAVRAESNYELVHERDTSSASITSALLSDRPRTRELFEGHPPSRIFPNDQSTRRPPEVYRPVQPTEAGNVAAVDADVFRPDELPEVPFSSQAAAFFASRAPSSTVESAPLRRPDTIGPDRMNTPSYFPWVSRFEEDFAMSPSRLRAMAGERRHRVSPEPERPIRRFPVAELPRPSASASRSLDIEEFQHGPFRATLERLERQERQEQQLMMERQAEIDRLRSRLNELQSLERSVTSSRAPTLPPLRLDRDASVSEASHRMPSPTLPASIETPSFRPDLEGVHRTRSWQRGRGSRASWLHPHDETTQWRSSSGLSSSIPLPIPRAHSPSRPLPESRNVRPAPERERERRGRPEPIELWGLVDVDDPLDSLATSPAGDSGFFARSLARMRGEHPSTDRQQQRREPRGHSPWTLEHGRSASREPHADALRGIRPLWATHTLGPWGTEAREENLAAGPNVPTPTDVIPRGRRRRANQPALPSQGRNGPEEERPPAARRASSTSRYAATRRAIRDPIMDRVQRMVRGSPRESGFFGRYPRGRNQGDFVRDEDFDSSYESLLSLAATIGEVRPRHTPDHVIESLPTSTFKVWRNAESDQRCPICLDDYQEEDLVMKLSDCSHWLHKNCLQQWLRGATTCPVCRQRVRGPQSTRRDRGAQADPQPGSSRVAAAFDIVREIREQVRMALPDPATGASRSEAGPSGGRSQVERELDQEESMPFGW